MSRIEQWFKTAVGRGMNPDKAYGYQCKDVADDYCIYLFGNWQNTIRPANAKDAFARSNPDYFVKIANNLNDPNLIPQRGDIIIWGASRANPYGHIAVVASADTSGATVVEQDGFKNTVPAYRAKRGYIYAGMPCIGWLRPRPEKIIGYTPPAPAVAKNERVLAVKAHARNEANTRAGVFQTINAGFKVAMKGYVTNGQAIDGDTVWFVTARSNKYMSRQVFIDKGLHDLADLTPKPEPVPTPPTPEQSKPEPAPKPAPEIKPTESVKPNPVLETPKPAENSTSENAVKPQLPAQQQAETQKMDSEPSSTVKTQEKIKQKEQITMSYDENAITKLNATITANNQLANDVAQYDEVKKLIGKIDQRVKLAVYIIGDMLIGTGLILPSLAVALNFGTLQQVQALSSACATAGAFVLTMFGIYKSGRDKR